MVKTTIILDDDLYRKLIEECIAKYGSTRKLSKLINEKLRRLEKLEADIRKREHSLGKTRIKLNRILKPEDIEKLIEDGWMEVIKWST